MNQHIAHRMPFDELLTGLRAAVESGHVAEREGPEGLRLFCYTQAAVYDRVWTPHTLAARGLILHPESKTIVATPFPKFFNHGERPDTVPALPFDVYDKMDGSLAIIFHWNGQWRVATKGSFQSDQAKLAATLLNNYAMAPGFTYLAELIGPSNRIIARYPRDKLVLLAIYDNAGHYEYPGFEMPRHEVEAWGRTLRMPVAPKRSFTSIAELLDVAHTLPLDEEGFVIRFENGHRLKIKGDEYRRIHAMVSKLSPLSVWEAMMARDDLDAFRKELPEEFWTDFDQMRTILGAQINALMAAVATEAAKRANWTDKEIGLDLPNIPEPATHFVFPYRKYDGKPLDNPKARRAIFGRIRPTANRLEGYRSSLSLNRTQGELLG